MKDGLYYVKLRETKIKSIRYNKNGTFQKGYFREFYTIVYKKGKRAIDIFNPKILVDGKSVNLNGCVYNVKEIRELELKECLKIDMGLTRIKKFNKKVA